MIVCDEIINTHRQGIYDVSHPAIQCSSNVTTATAITTASCTTTIANINATSSSIQHQYNINTTSIQHQYNINTTEATATQHNITQASSPLSPLCPLCPLCPVSLSPGLDVSEYVPHSEVHRPLCLGPVPLPLRPLPKARAEHSMRLTAARL
jgi:hypothetical protein